MTQPDKSATHLKIGAITRPHGVRGELKVRLFNEDSSALWDVSHLILEGPKGDARRCDIKSVRGSAKGPILDLEGVHGRDAADALRGYTIWVERESLQPLEEGEYYLIDMIGCDVELGGTLFAKVVDVRPDPSVDTMVIERPNGGRAEVPIVHAWIGVVDVKARKIELLSEDGVIDS
jgi:16S rRNA processing protein RimM